MKPSCISLVLVLLVGCGTIRAVHLDTVQGEPLAHTPRAGQETVRLREGAFRQSLAELARDVKPTARPVRNARQVMFEAWQEEVYLEWTGQRLEVVSPETRGPRLLPEQDMLTRGYGRWCERRGTPGDCFSLLKDTASLDADGRYTLAMAIAVDSVWEETKAAMAAMADPEAVRASIVSALAMYMMLWVLPEPVSKGLAATLTAGLIAYLGIDTVRGLIGGWIRLVGEVDRARSFEELREAGERYGRVMGRHAARAFVLLATAAIGNTAGLATKGPGLPGYSQAAVVAETQGGFRLAALSEVRSVAMSAEGAFSIALAPGAVAMTAPGTSDGSGSDVAAAIKWKGFSKGSLSTHYDKHVKAAGEFGGSISQGEYLKLAKEFAAEKGGWIQERLVGNLVVKYDPKTHRVFIGHAKDREIRTFYQADGRTDDPFAEAVRLAEERGGR
jgi:hypothetical protein